MERLTKRVKEMEKWIAENEGGPTLNNMNYLITSLHNTTEYAQNMEKQFNAQRNLMAEFFGLEDLTEKWNEFLQKKQEDEENLKIPLPTEKRDGIKNHLWHVLVNRTEHGKVVNPLITIEEKLTLVKTK